MNDPKFTLPIEQAAQKFEAAGVPRSIRTLQRYCQQQRIAGLLTDTADGQRWFLDEHSVDRAIAELVQLEALTDRSRHVTSQRDVTRSDAPENKAPAASAQTDMPRHDATERDTTSAKNGQKNEAPADDMTRQHASQPAVAKPDAAAPATAQNPSREVPAASDRYVGLLEAENAFLHRQLETKDGQIKELTERSRETNTLILGLQKMLTPLLGTPKLDRAKPAEWGSQDPNPDEPDRG